MTDVYEFAEYERENLIYKFATLTDSEALVKKENYEKFQAEKEAQKAAAAAKPKETPKDSPAENKTE
jgi:NADH-quinone oxidoreductase subunit I